MFVWVVVLFSVGVVLVSEVGTAERASLIQVIARLVSLVLLSKHHFLLLRAVPFAVADIARQAQVVVGQSEDVRSTSEGGHSSLTA